MNPLRLFESRVRAAGGLFSACLGLVVLLSVSCKREGAEADQFNRLTNLGRSQLESGDAGKAVELFRQALALNPTLIEAQLNLANASLKANQLDQALAQAQQVLQADRNSAPAYYLMGCAYLRQGRAEEALKALEQSHQLDAAVTALNFQLALAHERLGHSEEAIAQLQVVLQFEPDHPAAHYRLSQLLTRAGRQPEAAEELKTHQALLAKHPNTPNDVSFFERCKHTQVRLPFRLELPLAAGVKVTFADITAEALPNAAACAGPIAVLDLAHDGRNSLLVRQGDSFRLLLSSGGKFVAQEPALPALSGARYRTALVGDLQNDQTEDVVLLSEQGSQVFKFTTNGVMTDISRACGFAALTAVDGALLDFDYTGKLGLLALQPDGKGVRAFRNLSSTFAMYFSENNVTSGLPAALPGGQRLVLEDWNNDELMDVTITRESGPPLVFVRERGSGFVGTNAVPGLPAAAVLVTGDLNNDALPDAVAAGSNLLTIQFGGAKPPLSLPAPGFTAETVQLFDYDNDGWLDIVAAGNGLRVWRNLGGSFRETTGEL
ncbi:MAG TPA: tetratricopeptide repeat protein, partial [Candidatus Saccharimonadales bacterium]|nr:tetratricopeptide repeat protein [Candidatus Saccharimonadales bacterium]